jgi:hypothetical protein
MAARRPTTARAIMTTAVSVRVIQRSGDEASRRSQVGVSARKPGSLATAIYLDDL